jgi:hypothetical protein
MTVSPLRRDRETRCRPAPAARCATTIAAPATSYDYRLVPGWPGRHRPDQQRDARRCERCPRPGPAEAPSAAPAPWVRTPNLEPASWREAPWR